MTIKKQKQNKDKEARTRATDKGKGKGEEQRRWFSSCLRQSGSCFAAVFDAGLKPSSISEAKARAVLQRLTAHLRASACGRAEEAAEEVGYDSENCLSD
jgi:hypothetical protein